MKYSQKNSALTVLLGYLSTDHPGTVAEHVVWYFRTDGSIDYLPTNILVP